MAEMHAPLSFSNLMPFSPATQARAAAGGGYKAPLSGDVTQSILPWRWAFDWIGNQFSLLTVNLGRSPAPDVERDILDNVGSYGRQLGRLSDVVEVLVARLPRESLSKEEAEALEDFAVEMREIKRIKHSRGR